MAENRRIADLYFGQPGVLTYIPSGQPGRLGALHSTRITCNAPRFGIIGSTANLYAPSRPVFPSSSRISRDTFRIQGRWLSNSHPEAFIGGASAFSGMLKDSVNCSKHSEESEDERSAMAMGEMTDLRPSRSSVVPLLAVATGASGQKLRLAMAEKTRWQWGEHQDALLHVSVIDTTQQENETIWVGDGLPIINVKFVKTWWQSGIFRWLLVHTKTSVTILQPEFHPIPVPDHAKPSSDDFQPPSYVAPNPLIALHQKETGGNDISDVCFIPASMGSLPRLCVIDQCGYWSIWTLLGTWKVSLNTLRLSLDICGHISESILGSLPRLTTYPAQRHGILWIGQTADLDHSQSLPKQKRKKSSVPSQSVLIWNAQHIVILDLDKKKLLPELDILRQSRLAPDWITGVERSPANGSHVFVLTAKQIIWLDLSLTSGVAGPVLRPTILVACSHVGFGNEDYRISTCRASEDYANSALVFIHSPRVGQLTIYWFEVSPETQLPQYHRHITSLSSGGEESAITKAQLIKVCPAKLEASEASGEPGPGQEYIHNGVEFYLMMILGEDLSVRYCMCAASPDPAMEVTLPILRASWSRSREMKRFKKRRRRFLKHLGETFVVPDGITDESMATLLRRKGPKTDQEESLDEGAVLHKPRPRLLNMNRICREIASSLLSAINQGAHGLPTDMVPIVRSAIDHGVSGNGLIPLTSWIQLFSNVQRPFPSSEPSNGMESEIRELVESSGDNVVITQLRRCMTDELPGSLLEYPALVNEFSHFWLASAANSLPPEVQQIRHVWVCEAARDFFLSSYGFMVQDVPILRTSTPDGDVKRHHVNDMAQQSSSQRTQRGPEIATSSPAGPSSSSPDVEDAAFRRLRLLAPTLEPGTLGALKAPKVLSYWPTDRGVAIDDYVSSVAAAEEAKFSHIKARRKRVQTKMEAQAEMFEIPPFRRQEVPAGDGLREDEPVVESRRRLPMQIMSSQQAVPGSSQSFGVSGPPVTMSQPVSGVFGDRKMVKKKGKRKSGFR